jgi:class 3 adenylate cyclase
LLLGDIGGAAAALRVANTLSNNDLAAIASTRRQLSLLTNDQSVLSALSLPSIIHFAGHIISSPGEAGRFPADQEQAVKDSIKTLLDDLDVGVGYGSLAAGADILFAEEILHRGGEIHLVLPFDKEDFLRVSVAGAGSSWVERFEYCWKRASSQNFSSEGEYQGDGTLFDYCSLSAMGRATLRHSHLGAPIAQVIAWDGKQTDVHYGTAKDRKTWMDMGYQSHEIKIENSSEFVPVSKKSGPKSQVGQHPKELRAVIFGDVMGFSKLSDSQIPTFVHKVMGCLAQAIDQIDIDADERSVLMANTWGDGLFIVCKDVVSAARCAINMQEAISALDLSADGFDDQAKLRLGVHFGPVYEFIDPVTKVMNFFGAHVNRTARIEPIAPPGEVYVTEEFAAQLALEQSSEFETVYVGQMPMAKNYGQLRMYLTRNKIAIDA